jgi:hypothetical protein
MPYQTGPRRYRLVRLKDGRIHASDNVDAGKKYYLTPRPALRARYALSRGGELLVQAGRVTGVSGSTSSAGYSVARLTDGTIRLKRTNDARWQLTIAPTGILSPRDRFAVLDARDGTLLLVDVNGIRELSVSPDLSARVGGGVALQPDGPLMFEYADDFAP